jgi:hypothetical protein
MFMFMLFMFFSTVPNHMWRKIAQWWSLIGLLLVSYFFQAEPEFLIFKGVQESIPWNQFR